MNTLQATNDADKSGFSRVSVFGLLLFMLGGVDLYVPESSHSGNRTGFSRYVVLVLLAGIIAGVVELSVHWV